MGILQIITNRPSKCSCPKVQTFHGFGAEWLGTAANKQHVALASVSSRHDLVSTLLFLIGSVIEQNIVEEINLHHKVAY